MNMYQQTDMQVGRAYPGVGASTGIGSQNLAALAQEQFGKASMLVGSASRPIGRIEGQILQLNESIAAAHKLLHGLTDQIKPILGHDPRNNLAKGRDESPVEANLSPVEVQLAATKAMLQELVQAIGSLASAVRT